MKYINSRNLTSWSQFSDFKITCTFYIYGQSFSDSTRNWGWCLHKPTWYFPFNLDEEGNVIMLLFLNHHVSFSPAYRVQIGSDIMKFSYIIKWKNILTSQKCLAHFDNVLFFSLFLFWGVVGAFLSETPFHPYWYNQMKHKMDLWSHRRIDKLVLL